MVNSYKDWKMSIVDPDVSSGFQLNKRFWEINYEANKIWQHNSFLKTVTKSDSLQIAKTSEDKCMQDIRSQRWRRWFKVQIGNCSLTHYSCVLFTSASRFNVIYLSTNNQETGICLILMIKGTNL